VSSSKEGKAVNFTGPRKFGDRGVTISFGNEQKTSKKGERGKELDNWKPTQPKGPIR